MFRGMKKRYDMRKITMLVHFKQRLIPYVSKNMPIRHNNANLRGLHCNYIVYLQKQDYAIGMIIKTIIFKFVFQGFVFPFRKV